ncbi:MAG: hypothetical protein PHS14_09280 [Elusimicrobia bacterium]|nr:hypothetical protein [Elusimicrobiota bacterium]
MSECPEGSIKIALIEPEASDVARIRELVKTGSIPADVADVMASENPDLESAEIMLIGLHDLGATERELLARLHAGFPATPLIVLAGSDSPSLAAEAVRLGAHHVLLKSRLTPEKLSSTIRYFVHYTLDRKRPAPDSEALAGLPAPKDAFPGP